MVCLFPILLQKTLVSVFSGGVGVFPGICEGVAYYAMSHIFTLGTSGKNQNFFVIKVCYEKLGRILKLLVPKYRPDLSARLKDMAEKQVTARVKPIVISPTLGYLNIMQRNLAQPTPT